jgi:hypothetical protein
MSESDDSGDDLDACMGSLAHSDPVRGVMQGRMRVLQQRLVQVQLGARERVQQELAEIEAQLAQQFQAASKAVQEKQVIAYCR